MKKLLLFIALTIFGLGLNAQNVGDETTIDYDGYSLKFEITSVSPAECEVSDYTGEPVDVTIPSTVTISGIEFTVTSIGDWAFYYCSSLTSIEIPNSVTSVGDRAFRGCSSLTSIEIPNSVTSIGWYAFSYCSSLTSIEIPNSITSIGDWAFYQCSSLTSIVVAEGNTVYDSRENCNAIIETSSNTLIAGCQNTVIPNSVTSIGACAFSGCSSLTGIEIPNSVTFIGNYAFYYCSSLTSVTFGENSQLTSIGHSAFYECSSLTSIEIPNSVTSIGDWAFYQCSSLTSIEIPNSVTSICWYAFSSCSSLTSIEIPNSVTSIENSAFSGCSSLTSIEIPNSVTSIDISAFRGCSSLTSIEIPNSVTSIDISAFRGCSSLTSIVVAEGNTVYDSRENCNAIIGTSSNTLIAGCQNTVIPNSVTSIGLYAFSECSSLTSIEIPNSVTSIGYGAFSGCSSLTSIEIPNSVTSIGISAFRGCSSLTSIVVAEGNTVYDSRENCNAIIGTSGNILIAGCQNTVIPNSVTSIGDYAFSDCDGLTSIEIPNSVTYIGSWAFERCSSLTSIEIPNSVTSIGVRAFSYCSSLGVIKCYAEDVPETGDYVFDYCPSDMTIYVPEVSLENYKATYPWNQFTIFSLNEAPLNITATTESVSSVNLSWDDCHADSYNVYRNGYSIANVNTNSYLDNNLEPGTEYCYTVTAVRNENETDKSEEACAKTLGESIEELSSAIRFYPNPVDNELFLATELRVEEIAIYDIYGRQTMSQQVNETTSQQVVEVADLEAGVYFVKVVTSEGEVVKRFVKN